MNKLSHTAISIYNECSYKYKLNYIDRVRPKVASSALIFGSAIDKAIEGALKSFPDCVEIKTKSDFALAFQTTKVNDVEVNTASATPNLIKWSLVDFDEDLGTSSYESMLVKGYLIIESFYKNVIPKIEKVISVQEEISLVNNNGDAIVGFCDTVVKLKDFDKNIILDIKTAGRAYEAGAVRLSEQLALYKHALSEKYNTNLVGFAAFSKAIKKTITKECCNCGKQFINPRVKKCDAQASVAKSVRCNGELKFVNKQVESPFQLMIDTVDENFVDNVLNDFDIVNAELQVGEFKKNFKSCYGKYGKCGLYEYCRNGNREDFIIKEKKIIGTEAK